MTHHLCGWLGTILVAVLSPAILFGQEVIPAADRPDLYLPLLQEKRVAMVVNHSSIAHGEHLVDFLLKKRVKIRKIFAPEHGFRGASDAGEALKDSRDTLTGLPILSLYGQYKKPTDQDLADIDLIVFDIQDVGVRFYTYLSTLHYVMEAAAQQHIPVVLLDRPNPNGQTIDGPVLKRGYRSFVGLDPVPIVYGMTIGEYAQMLNGEGWLGEGVKAQLTVVPLANYTHESFYSLPLKPSPNLQSDRAVLLYPSLAFFEGTVISEGRGTTRPFELYGAPTYSIQKFSFVPQSRAGAKDPKFEGELCYGIDLSSQSVETLRAKKQLDLSYLLDAYRHYPDPSKFFLKNGFMDKLAGSDTLRKQILSGVSKSEIRKSWQKELDAFKKIREKYLLYP